MNGSRITLKDSGVSFNQKEHRYFLGGKELQGVTSTLIRRAFPGTYDGIPQAVLDEAAARGTQVHELVELFNSVFNGDDTIFPADAWTPELKNYVGIVKTNGLHHLASEYIVTDGARYASAIDGVYLNGDGGIVLVDYKTTSQLYYESVALQLSIYARFFEAVNPELKVSAIACIWLRGDRSRFVELPRVSDELLDRLVEADTNDDASYVYEPEIPDGFYRLEAEYVRLTRELDALKTQQEAVRGEIIAFMENNKAKSYKTSYGAFTMVPGTVAKKFDTASFRKAQPDLYEEYLKESTVAPGLRIKLK